MEKASRTRKVEALLESMHSLKRRMAFPACAAGREPKVTPSQWAVLMLLAHRGPGITVKEAADMLGITSSAATQLIDGLVKSGYVVRSESAADRRAVILALSAKSKKQVAAMKKLAVARFLKAFEVLSDREFDQYCALNKKIVQGMDSSASNSFI